MDDSQELLSTIIALLRSLHCGAVPLLVAEEDEVPLLFTMLFDEFASGWPLVAMLAADRPMLEFRLVLMLTLLLLLLLVVVAPVAACVIELTEVVCAS